MKDNLNFGDDTGLSAMPETHRHYEFGTFEERLAHICALFEIQPPEITYEDGDIAMTAPLMDWIKNNDVNIDWLIAGSPCAMLRAWSKSNHEDREIMQVYRQVEPEVQAGFLAFLRAVMIHGVPMKDAEPILTKVVQEFRAASGG